MTQDNERNTIVEQSNESDEANHTINTREIIEKGETL